MLFVVVHYVPCKAIVVVGDSKYIKDQSKLNFCYKRNLFIRKQGKKKV